MINPYSHTILSEDNAEDKPIGIVEGAWTWFGRPNWAYSAGANKWFLGSVTCGRGYVTEHDLTTGKFTPTSVGGIIENDDHNQVQLLIRNSDSRLIAFYSGHNHPEIRYRISTNPSDATSWGNEIILNDTASGNKSYVSPYQASNGDIYIIYRGTFYDLDPDEIYWFYRKSTDGGLTFSTAVKIWDSSPVAGYAITYQDGDKIHFCATPGNPTQIDENDLGTYHFYFDLITETSHGTDGTQLTMPVTTSNITSVWQVPTGNQSWVLDIITKNGAPRILYAYYLDILSSSEGIDKRVRYAEWNGASWDNREICQTQVGYMEEINIQETYYTGSSRFCQSNPDLIFIPMKFNSEDPEEVLELYKYDLRTGNFKQLTFNSKYNNWRPVSIPSPFNNLVWLSNINYNHFTDFRILIKAMTVNTD